jgi:hypothetical protein
MEFLSQVGLLEFCEPVLAPNPRVVPLRRHGVAVPEGSVHALDPCPMILSLLGEGCPEGLRAEFVATAAPQLGLELSGMASGQ